MVTLTEALADEARADMWCRARTDNHAFDEVRFGIQVADANFEVLAEAEREWQWSVESVAGALMDECGEAAAELLWRIVQDRVCDPGLEGPSVPGAIMITQAVLIPRRACDRLPDDGDDAHGLPHA